MSIVKQFENITIQEFEEQYRDDVLNFELSERQQIYSSLPKSVLEDALKDENRVANIAINENGDVVDSSYFISIINMKDMIHLSMSFMFDHCLLMKNFKDKAMVQL